MDQSYLYTENKEEVVLTDDPPINGQTWACLSFVSPESVIQDKDGFTVAKFLQSYARSNDKDFKKLYEEFMNFKYKHSDKIDSDFSKENKNITSVRGVKVRGVYSTQDDARLRAELLHKQDPSFHVFIGTVGQWLPWDPSSDKIDDEVYLDDGLNTLVSEYKRQSNDRDKVFSERMSDIRKEQSGTDDKDYNVNISADNFKLQNDDPWTKSKVSETSGSDMVSNDPILEESDNVTVSRVVETMNESSDASESVETTSDNITSSDVVETSDVVSESVETVQ